MKNIAGVAFLPQEKRSLTGIATIYGTRMLGLFMLLPVLTLFAPNYAGATPILVGICLGAYGISQAIFQIPFGILSDLFGRKLMISLGLLLFLLGSIIAAMSTSIWGLIIGRLLQGAGAVASVLMALLADQTSDAVRTKAMAFIGMSIGGSFFLAFLVGPIVANYFSLAGLFWITAALVMVSFLILWLVVPSLPATKSFTGHFKRLSEVIKNKMVMKLTVGVFFLHTLITLLFIALPTLIIDHFNWSVSQLAWFYLPVLSLSFCIAVPIMLYLERRGKTTLLFGLAQMGLFLGMLLLSIFAKSTTGIILATFLFFVGFHLLEAMLPSLLSKQVTADSRGAAMGVFSTCQFSGTFLGGLLGGIVYNFWHDTGVFFLGAIIVVICYIAFSMFGNISKIK